MEKLDIEIYCGSASDDGWAQAKYLVHGCYDDVLWTDDLGAALAFLKESIRQCEDKF